MDRRELLKRLSAVAAVPLVKWGPTPAVEAEVSPHKQYLIFYDVMTVDAPHVAESVHPNCEAWLIGVRLRNGQTMDDVVRLYEIGEVKAGA